MSAAFVTVHDLVAFRSLSIMPAEYCRVSEESARDRGLEPGELTTSEADSGCRSGEVHLCGDSRFVLAEVIEAKPPPC